MIARAKVWKFGSNVDTDVIFPGKYFSILDPEEMGKHCMEGVDPAFTGKISKGDIIVAGKNFGSGSSREQAPLALKYSGISCIIATSFSRIFYRNALNIGLPIFECADAEKIGAGDEVSIDETTGLIEDHTTGAKYQAVPFPPFMQELIRAGGLVPYIRKKLGK